jgi:virginiamycin A acetyltransferase
VADETSAPIAALKSIADAVAFVLVLPLGAASGLERRLRPNAEGVFHFCAHTLALLPGLPGAYLRRAFYRLALDRCDAFCHIGFGAMFTHREVLVGRGVYVGTWALVGSADLREGTSIGSRASLLSGTELHEFRGGQWTPFDAQKLRQIVLGPHAFVGEGAIVMADVGAHTMVASGAVVSATVPDGIVVAGNPARFVRRVEPLPDSPAVAVGAQQ